MSDGMRRASLAWALVDVAVVATIIAVSLAHLPQYLVNAAWHTPFHPSFAAVLPTTAFAALRVWAFWGASAAVIAAMLLRYAPSLGLADAILGGTFAFWVLAYLTCNLLGPIGLLQPWLLRLALLVGIVAVVRRPPTIRRPSLSTGQRLTLIALAIGVPGLTLVELGSPVPPHFDVFATAASAQRVLTFHHYFPFDNDPYGYYDAASQCPGTELLYAFLALGSGVPFAILADTGSLAPLAALLILASARLGKTLGGDRAGGMAALCLFGTVLFRTLPTGHGRYVAFVPVAAGLAFFLDGRRHPVRLVLGALTLGIAVAAHAIIGAFGMVTAAATVLLWILSGDFKGGFAGVGLLAAASLVALPTIAVALRLVLPYPVLPLAQLAGVGLAVWAARLMPVRRAPEARWALALIAGAVVAWMWKHPGAVPTVHDHLVGLRYPILWSAGLLGLAVAIFAPVEAVRPPMVFMLLAGIAAELVSKHWQETVADPRVAIAFRDLIFKADFWYPFALVFPAGCLAAAVARLVSTRITVYALLALLFFPWLYGNTEPGRRDPNYFEHSIVEGWAEQVSIAKNGYWGSSGDRRWAQTPAEFELVDVLRGEIAAGRITLATHITHLTPYIFMYMDTVLFSVFTGIDDDLYVSGYVFDQSNAGGRFYPAQKIHDALTRRPPYVVIHDVTKDGRRLDATFPDALALEGYDVIFARDGVRLLRARSLSASDDAATRGAAG